MQSRSLDARLRNVQQRRSRESVKRFEKKGFFYTKHLSQSNNFCLLTSALRLLLTLRAQKCDTGAAAPNLQPVTLCCYTRRESKSLGTRTTAKLNPPNQATPHPLFKPLQATNARFQLEPSPAELVPWMLPFAQCAPKDAAGRA